MDDLALLRGFDRDAAGPSEEVLAASRRALDAAARGDARAHPAARRRGIRPAATASSQRRPRLPARGVLLGAGALLAACTAVALLATGLVPTAPANAAEALRAAATAVETAQPSTSGVRVHGQRFVQSFSRDQAAPPGNLRIDQSVLIEYTETLRAVDGGTDWVRTWSRSRPLKAWGRDAERLMDQERRDASTPDPDRASTDPEFWSGLGPDQIRAMPRDPAVLLQRLAATPNDLTAAQTRTGRAFVAAEQILESGLADPELQSATYRALELLPDLQATTGADIDGRPGVVISIRTSTWRSELVIDRASGRYLGSTLITLKAHAGAPAGTVAEATAVYAE